MSNFEIAMIFILVVCPVGYVYIKHLMEKSEEEMEEEFDTAPASRKRPIVNDLLSDKELKKLYELAEKILADSEVSLSEAKQLQRWFAKHPFSEFDSNTCILFSAIEDALEDGVFDEDEEDEIFTLLTEFTESYEEDDSNDEFEIGASVDLLDLEVNHQYRMTYKDASNNISERSIIMKELSEKDGRQYLKAVCMNKHAIRTFRADRVQELYSLETGEALV